MYNKLQKINYVVSEDEYETAVTKLKKYNQGMSLLNQKFPECSFMKRYTEPLDRLRIQNSRFQDCEFLAPIVRTNLSGSRLTDCKLIETQVDNSNFQFSNLKNCLFKNCAIEGSNFANCYLDNVTCDGNTFIGSNFSRTYFEHGVIKNGELLSSTLEFAIFSHTMFENLRLANLSMEYSEFDNVKMNNVILPFAQLPFIFNGLDYIFHTQDKIAISANKENCQSISVEEYIETLDDWKVFFAHNALYFPLANILLVENRLEDALKCILNGIILTLNRADYRTLKYLCKLAASQENVPKTECHKLYERIEELIAATNPNTEQQYNYITHMTDIKNILVENPKCKPQLYISMRTSILPENSETLFYIVNFLEVFFTKERFGIDSKTISIKHNSPYEIILLMFGGVVILKQIVELVQAIISGVKISTENLHEICYIWKHKTKSEDIDLELKRVSLEKEKLEVEKMQLEIQNLQQQIREKQLQFKITHDIQEQNKIYIA